MRAARSLLPLTESAIIRWRGEPVQVLYPGDVALCPPGVKHWHGGSADASFGHIAVNTNPELAGLTWFDRITEEEYAALPAEKDVESDD